MTVVSTVQWKGGVGKSTLAVHLASILEAVLIDLDPTGSATFWWAGPRAPELWQAAGDAPVLRALARGTPPRPRQGAAGRPRLVPSHEQLLALMDIEGGELDRTAAWAWTVDGRPTLMVPTGAGPRRLSHALRDAIPRWADAWGQPVVVDTPAGFGALADGAVAASDVVLLPVTLDMWSVPVMRKFVRSYGPGVKRGLVVPNRVRDRISDAEWGELIADGAIEPPFELGPLVRESEVLHIAPRPLTAGPTPGAARAAVLEQLQAVADRVLELAKS